MPMTPLEFRSKFPSLDSLTHLASCSQGALSVELSRELQEFQDSIALKGAPWVLWMKKVEEARLLFAEFIGASADEVAIVSSASAGAYQVASTQHYADRNTIVSTDLEFPSVAHVWHAQEAHGAKTKLVLSKRGQVDVSGYDELIDERTKLVSIPLITYRNGSRLPVSEVIKVATERGAKTFIDAYQGLGVEPVDVKLLDCDYLVAGSLKYMLGISGIAFLYARGGLVDDLDPQLTGWFGRKNPFAFDPSGVDYPVEARRFESGTPSIPSAYAAVAGLKMLSLVDQTSVKAHVAELTARLHEAFEEMGEELDSPASPMLRGPQVALIEKEPEVLGKFLADRNIVVSPRGTIIRMAFHYYNSYADVDAVIAAVKEFRALNTNAGGVQAMQASI